VLSLLVSLGCDDPAAAAKALAVLEHGIVAAQIRCAGTLTRTTSPFDTRTLGPSSFIRFPDGAFMSTGSAGTEFCERNEACAENNQVGPFSVGDGIIALQDGAGPENVFTAPVEERCTGFNLEAFGVE